MKGFRLTDAQIRQRLQEGRNYKRLYFELKSKYDVLLLENKQLRLQLAGQEAKLETQAARITELETMVFGRRKRPRSGAGKDSGTKGPKIPRDSASYRRPKPPADEITSEERYPIDTCHHCHKPLTGIQVYTRYVEDIILAALSTASQFKTVVRQSIERGWCVSCGKYSSAKDLRGSDVVLGPNVRALVIKLVTVQDLSLEQTIQLLYDLYQFKINDSEIVAIMDAHRQDYLPEYERLKDSIRAGPALHMDESRYRIQSEGGAGYGFSMSSTINSDVVFKLAESRGKAHAKELIGDHYTGVGITDRYGAYKHLFENEDGSSRHQICWAHLQRTAKDLTHLECLSKAKQQHVNRYHAQLSAIYTAIRTYQREAFDKDRRDAQAADLLEQVIALCQPHKLDPKKLSDLKAGIVDYQDSLFVCLTVDGIPADNNRAERDIRKLVMKRKRSLGVKTPKGAHTLEVLLSVCWSVYNRDRANYFKNFLAIGTAA